MPNLISRSFNNITINQRNDNYFHLTAMAQANGKHIGHYLENKTTQEYLKELELTIGIPIVDLVQVKNGGVNPGTWAHKYVAIHFAQWCNAAFAVQVTLWADEKMYGSPEPAKVVNKLGATVEQSIACLNSFKGLITSVSPALVEGITLNELERLHPETKELTKQARSLIAATNTTELLLGPTEIGKLIGLSAKDVNKLLLAEEYQYVNPKTRLGKFDSKYLPTNKGKSFTSFTLATGQNNDNSTFQNLKWKETIIDELKQFI